MTQVKAMNSGFHRAKCTHVVHEHIFLMTNSIEEVFDERIAECRAQSHFLEPRDLPMWRH